jgi:hypothetical protein
MPYRSPHECKDERERIDVTEMKGVSLVVVHVQGLVAG